MKTPWANVVLLILVVVQAVTGYFGMVNGRIFFQNYVQDHIIIGRVFLMAVVQPVGCLEVHFHIAGPQGVADANAGVEEVRAGVSVISAGTTTNAGDGVRAS